MSETMIKIKDKEFSESTIVEALKKHCLFEDEPKKELYKFKPGDVVTTMRHEIRLITSNGKGGLLAIDTFGLIVATALPTDNSNFCNCWYTKIGELKAFVCRQ